MRKASKILFLVAGIVSIVVAVTYLIIGIVFVALPNTQAFIEALTESYNTNPPSSGVTLEQFIEGGKILFTGLGVVFLVVTAFAAINSVFAFKAFNDSKNGRPSTAMNVLNIVFGFLGGVEINVVGAIFALIANGQEDRRKAIENR